jgi:MYXO-CTERM domain-containing protein
MQSAIRSVAAAGAASLAAILGSSAQASITLGNGDTVLLSEVFAEQDRTVYIGDKEFKFESWASSVWESSQITLSGFISQNANQFGLYNVGFDLFGGFGDGTPGDGQIHEANLQYTVAVRPEYYDRGVRLCDAHLLFNGSSSGVGSYARVDETILDLDSNTLLGQLSVFDQSGPPPQQQLSDGRDFCLTGTPGFRAFEVNKDLKFFASGDGGTSAASFVRQEFSQVPAPGAFALLGLAGLAGSRRRRS